MTDQNKNIVNKYFYTPFGILTNQQETIPQPFKYAGQYGIMQEPSGLYYMRARYYDPSIGRFISEDPLGFEGGDVNLYAYVDSVGKPIAGTDINLYEYAHNNPINFTDPYGLWYIDINISGGSWGGGTAGITIGSEGIGVYGGGGAVTPGVGGSITWSPHNQTQGWNMGTQVTAGIAYQEGHSFGESGGRFWEIGIGLPPSASITGYYQKLWKWSGADDNKKQSKK